MSWQHTSRFDEGVRIMANLVACRPEHARVGLAVVLEDEDAGEAVLYSFRPA